MNTDQHGWISVKDGLPDDEITVLIVTADRDVWTGYLEAGHWHFPSGDRVEAHPVTHWMEFPEPPEVTA
jgi:hypothetical protein